VNTPSDLNAMLKFLLSEGASIEGAAATVLSGEDERYLTTLVEAIRSGKRSVIIVEESDDKLKYMFSNATRAEAVSMLGKVIEATGRRLASGDE
jgi:hypothetical protein